MELSRDLGYYDPEITQIQRGSVATWWNTKVMGAYAAHEDLLREKGAKVIQEVEQAIELASVQKMQAEVDDKRTTSAERMIAAVHDVDNAITINGAVLVIKQTAEDGTKSLFQKTLSTREIQLCEKYPGILKNAATFLSDLAALEVTGATSGELLSGTVQGEPNEDPPKK